MQRLQEIFKGSRTFVVAKLVETSAWEWKNTDGTMTQKATTACHSVLRAIRSAVEPETKRLRSELFAVSEYLSSFDNDNRIPNHGFEDLSTASQLLKIENSVLEVNAFRNIAPYMIKK